MDFLAKNVRGKIGMGTAPLGNLFRDVPEDEAMKTVESAWNSGIRYFDTAPFYGAGLAEMRLGEALKNYNRDEYLLSSKVGRLVLDETENKEGIFENGRNNIIKSDYTADATIRSIEESLKRLNTDTLDVVFVHDISPDFYGDEWISKFEEARTGAFKVLTDLRKEGFIKSWGIGVNTIEPIELLLGLEDASPDVCLLATQYTLLDHERALQRVMPTAKEKDVGIVVGAPYSSGALLGGSHYNYGEIPPEVSQRIKQLGDVARRHDTNLKAAALQFSTAHPAVAAVIPWSTRPDRIKEDLDGLEASIPADFWNELVENKLISSEAPLPGSN